MVDAERGSLAFDSDWGRTQPSPEQPEPSLLDSYLSKIRDRIDDEGLVSLYWITGIRGDDIASSLLSAKAESLKVADAASALETRVVLLRANESRLADPLARRLGCTVRRLRDFCPDSFLIVNEAAVLDVTPLGSDMGVPEYEDEPTVVSLYIGLYKMLENRFAPP